MQCWKWSPSLRDLEVIGIASAWARLYCSYSGALPKDRIEVAECYKQDVLGKSVRIGDRSNGN